MSTGFVCALVMAFVVSVAVTAGGQQKSGAAAAKTLKNPVAPTPQSIAAGQKTYRMYCRLCHGTSGKGDGPQAPKDTHPSDLTDDTWDHGSSDAEIYAAIRDGIGPKFDMKGFRSKLTDQEMWNVVNYLRSIGPQAKTH
jgi:mono/diheme cytochrome c family protein